MYTKISKTLLVLIFLLTIKSLVIKNARVVKEIETIRRKMELMSVCRHQHFGRAQLPEHDVKRGVG